MPIYIYPMNRSFRLLLMVLLCTAGSQSLLAQTFDRLAFKTFPTNWSKRLEADKMIFSNYNILGANPMSVRMYRSAPHVGKPEEGFKKYWRQTFGLADTAAVPKFRKLINEEGDLYIMAGAELEGPEGKGFYQLHVYFLDSLMQGILLNAISAKAFKPEMYEWQERMAAVAFLKKK
jgi:hypothetical protein